MISKPGRYKISFDEYLADPCPSPSLSRSVIMDLIDCPAKAFFKHPRLNPEGAKQEEAAHFDIGEASHSLLLEGINVAEVIDAPDWKKKEAREAREAARLLGKVPLLKAQYEDAVKMCNAARLAIAEVLNIDLPFGGLPEQSYFWEEKGTWFKIRPDWIRDNGLLILDYKTTGISANPENFSRIAISNGYDIQEVLYRRGVEAIEGIEPEFIFIVQEVKPPYLVAFIKLDKKFQHLGKQKIERIKKIWNDCLESGNWHGYPKQAATVDCPEWAIAQWEFKSMIMEEASGNIPF